MPAEFKVDYLLGQNAKLRKGEGSGWEAWGVEFVPADKSGNEVCPWRTPGCSAVCLVDSGMGQTPGTKRARMRRTLWFFSDRPGFLRYLVWEIESKLKATLKRNKRLAIRLNVFSDLSWENFPVERNGVQYENLMRAFPEVQFFDYTKGIARALKETRALRDLPNYHLTFSLAETEANRKNALIALQRGVSVTAVFLKQDAEQILRQGRWTYFPEFAKYPVTSADENDLRFLDPPSHLLILIAKGTAKKASGTTGVAVRAAAGGEFVQPFDTIKNPSKRKIGGGCSGVVCRVNPTHSDSQFRKNYNDGFRAGRADRALGTRNEYAALSHAPGLPGYSQGYNDGNKGLPFDAGAAWPMKGPDYSERLYKNPVEHVNDLPDDEIIRHCDWCAKMPVMKRVIGCPGCSCMTCSIDVCNGCAPLAAAAGGTCEHCA